MGHHPAGTRKKVSWGVIQSASNEVVNHSAFTLGGSSGAPIASPVSKKVIAVHTAGSVDERKLPDQKNHYGITIAEIAQELQNQMKKNGYMM